MATRIVRAGTKVQRLAGSVLPTDGVPVLAATCLVVRPAQADVSVQREPSVPPPPPAEASAFELSFMSGDQGYHRAVEWRIARGRWGAGPVAAWLRLRAPLIAGETPTPPLESLVVAADSSSGVAVAVDLARATFVNGDLTIAVYRSPVGEWFCLDAATTAEAHGVGLTWARLWDTVGLVQTLLIEPRAPARTPTAADHRGGAP